MGRPPPPPPLEICVATYWGWCRSLPLPHRRATNVSGAPSHHLRSCRGTEAEAMATPRPPPPSTGPLCRYMRPKERRRRSAPAVVAALSPSKYQGLRRGAGAAVAGTSHHPQPTRSRVRRLEPRPTPPTSGRYCRCRSTPRTAAFSCRAWRRRFNRRRRFRHCCRHRCRHFRRRSRRLCRLRSCRGHCRGRRCRRHRRSRCLHQRFRCHQPCRRGSERAAPRRRREGGCDPGRTFTDASPLPPPFPAANIVGGVPFERKLLPFPPKNSALFSYALLRRRRRPLLHLRRNASLALSPSQARHGRRGSDRPGGRRHRRHPHSAAAAAIPAPATHRGRVHCHRTAPELSSAAVMVVTAAATDTTTNTKATRTAGSSIGVNVRVEVGSTGAIVS